MVRQAGQCLRLIRSFATKHPLAMSGLTCRHTFGSCQHSVAETLQAMEVRWVAFMQASSKGTARLSSKMFASLPAWKTPSQTPRINWSDRQQQRQEKHHVQSSFQQVAILLPNSRCDAATLWPSVCTTNANRAFHTADAAILEHQTAARFVRYLHHLTEGGQFPCNPKNKK